MLEALAGGSEWEHLEAKLSVLYRGCLWGRSLKSCQQLTMWGGC